MVERELLDDLKRITGKQNLLFGLADITLAQPSRTALCAMRSFRLVGSVVINLAAGDTSVGSTPYGKVN